MQQQEPDNIKLAVLEEKVFNMVEVISKLDDTIEKLSDLSLNVSKMLAVHEEKLDFAKESAAETARELDEMEDRIQLQLDRGSDRIRSLERRVWVGLGIVLSIAIVVQSPTVIDNIMVNDRPATMESKSRP